MIRLAFILIASVLSCVWVMLEIEAHATLPGELTLSRQQSLVLFEDNSREALLSALKSIPWQENELSSRQSLLFASGQSRDAQGKRVLNRVQFFARPRFDIWLMKQSVAGRGFDFKDWNRVVIAMDRSRLPSRAYYFQLGTEAAGEKGLPPFKMFSAACATCHPSGPRVIRPELTSWTHDPSKADLSLLQAWNQKIKNYREVEDYRPRWQGRPMVEWGQPGDRDPLKLPSCIGCHATGSGVRSPLLRQNEDSIWYLVRHHADANGMMNESETSDLTQAEMPMEHAAFSKSELKCLRLWLDRDSQGLEKAGCTQDGTIPVRGSFKWVVDPKESLMEGAASAGFHKFQLKGFGLGGKGGCQGDSNAAITSMEQIHSCSGRLLIDLHDLETGIELRDRHLQSLLHQSGAELAQVELKNFDPRSVEAQVHLRVGHTDQTLPGKVHCTGAIQSIRCSINFEASLHAMGIEPPSFLGVTVKDSIQITGTMRLVKKVAPSIW